jgi:hypothetical protein
MNFTAPQLRALILNMEALAEHYLTMLQGEYPITGNHRLTVLLRRGLAMGRIAEHREQLASLSSAPEPTATKSNTTADSSPALQPTVTTDRPGADE